MNNIDIIEVIKKLGIKDDTWASADFNEINWTGEAQCTKTEWDTAIEEAKTLQPMKVLRTERNEKLTQTDWWAGSDLTMSADQTAYRKALRDLPSTASPTITDDGLNQKLTNVTWPTKP
mgnify:CR=1 FL=1